MSVATVPTTRTRTWHAVLAGALVVTILAVVWLYRDTILSMIGKWDDDAAFSYGFAIAPISLWLIWRRRLWLRHVQFEPSWLGAAVVVGGALLWVVAKGTGVLVLEQFAVVIIVQGMFLALLGLPAVRLLLFPVAFLVFLVPFGRALVPYLVDVTADTATALLQLSGVPVYRTHTVITIPGGSFRVARACSGVAFLMTALVLGLLYAEINFRNWKKRVVAVVLACAIPVIANALRVYITIGVAHLTNMQFGPGAEHIVFGQVFFIAITLVTFWIGRRWHDEDAAMPAWVRTQQGLPAVGMPMGRLVAPAIALLAAVTAPAYYAQFRSELGDRATDARESIVLPSGRGTWSGPSDDGAGWRPSYSGGLVERQGSYQRAGSDRVDVFVAVYGLGGSGNAEMVSYDNVLYSEEKEVVANVTVRRLELPDQSLAVRELVVPDGGGGRLVWHWYVVGARTTTSPYAVKALEAAAWITRKARHERVITLATQFDEDASARLEQFARAHAACVGSSFAVKACGG
jgi:exosortase A